MKKLMQFTTAVILIIALFSMPAGVQAQPSGQTGGTTFSGDQLILGDNYVLQSGQTLNGDLVVLGGNIRIDEGATVNGDIALLGGNFELGGEVKGTVASVGGNLSLIKGASITGEILTMGGNVNGAENATVSGGIRTFTPRALLFDRTTFNIPGTNGFNPVRETGNWFLSILGKILQVLAMAVLAVVVMLLMPKPTKNVAGHIFDQPWMSGGAGLLTFLVTPFVLIFLTITIILIPFTILAGLALGVAVVFGWIALGFELGKRLSVLLKTEWADAVSAGLGTLFLGTGAALIGVIPCVGGFINLLIASVGLGGVVLSVFGTRPSIRRAVMPQPVVEVIPPASPAPGTDPGQQTEIDSSGEN